mgnify:CR=1 FL=1
MQYTSTTSAYNWNVDTSSSKCYIYKKAYNNEAYIFNYKVVTMFDTDGCIDITSSEVRLTYTPSVLSIQV